MSDKDSGDNVLGDNTFSELAFDEDALIAGGFSPGRKLRVLLLIHSLSRTGSPLVALRVFQHLHKQIDLFTISMDDGWLRDDFALLGPVRVLAGENKPQSFFARALEKAPRGAILRWNGQQATRRFRKHFGTPDLIYVNSVGGLQCTRYLQIGTSPALLHIHEMEDGLTFYPPQAPQLFFSWPQRYIAVSQATRTDLIAAGIADERIDIVHEFIEADTLDNKLLEKSKPTKPFVVGGSGHINWRKGTELWLLTATRLREILGNDNVHFVWVGLGESDDDRRFQLKARKMGLGNIEFVPLTESPQEHFARFDVFAQTSWEDPCPLVVLENMLLQTPVACFARSGGAPEEIGDTGIVISDFNPHQMAEEIAALLHDSQRLQTLGKAARQRVLERFTSQTQVPKIADVIRRVLDAHVGKR